MLKMKNLSLFAVSGLMVFLTACGGGTQTSAPAPSGDAKPSSDAKPAQGKIVLKLAHWLTEDAPQGKQFKKFAELVNQKTNGEVEVQVFPNSQLGNQRDILEGVKAGTIDMAKADDAYLASYVPEYSLYSLPFVFRDYDHLGKVLDSDVTKKLDQKLLEKTGLRSLGWSFGGFRYFCTTKEITGPDLKGMKIRVPESDVYVETVKALNGSPTPMPWGDVYNGMSTGVVEGLEAAPSDIYLQKFSEVAKYLLATNHIQASATTIINENKWKTIPEKDQKIIQESLMEAAKAEREETKQANEDAIKKMVDGGMKVDKVDNTQAFADKVKPLWDKVADKVGPDGKQILQDIINTK